MAASENKFSGGSLSFVFLGVFYSLLLLLRYFFKDTRKIVEKAILIEGTLATWYYWLWTTLKRIPCYTLQRRSQLLWNVLPNMSKNPFTAECNKNSKEKHLSSTSLIKILFKPNSLRVKQRSRILVVWIYVFTCN